MLHIKDFVNKVSLGESKASTNVVLTIDNARGLRDELVILLTDLHELQKEKDNEETIVHGNLTRLAGTIDDNPRTPCGMQLSGQRTNDYGLKMRIH